MYEVLGVRMRRVREVGKEILSRPGRWRKVAENLKGKEARHDGKYVLSTDCDLPAEKVALAYKGLWRVEAVPPWVVAL